MSSSKVCIELKGDSAFPFGSLLNMNEKTVIYNHNI